MTCLACGRPEPGPLPPDALASICGPKERAIPFAGRELLCLRCQMWAATQVGIVERTRAEDLMQVLADRAAIVVPMKGRA